MKDTKKIVLLFVLMILSVYGNVIGNPVTSGNTTEKTEEKKEWKSNELKPDLDKDGKKDKLVIMYLIEPDRVVTKFIPYITDDKGKSVKGKEVEKIFGKSNFDNDFGNFMTSFIDSYPKKEVAKPSSDSNTEPKKENIKKAETKEKTEEKKPAEKTPAVVDKKPSTVEKAPVEKAPAVTEKNDVPEDLKKEDNITNAPQNTDTDTKSKDNVVDEGKQPAKNIKGPYTYINYYVKERPKNLTFNYKYDKNSPKDMDDFIFIKTATAVRKEPNTKSGVLKNAAYSHKYKVIGKVKTNVPGGTAEWYEVYFDGKLGYVLAANAIKREFDWNDMMKRAEKTNNFIKEAVAKNQKIYVLDDYTPLGGGNGSNKDKYGNKENQSERGYLSSSFKEFINIPDRSIMTITEETDKYIKVKIDVYDDKEYYLQKSNKKLLKDSGIKEEVSRFIYVDRHSQNEMIIEKNKDTNSWNVVTSSFVTTGKDGNGSYATPYGVFHVAYSKPVMQYTGSAGTVVGDAKNAVRFSGGGYMHSIPSLFEPKETRNQRKAVTAKKIGTYPESHKCIRHYDDQIKFIYDWLGNSSPGDKNGFRVPEVPTVMLVK
jgi:erfK/ybiS/ycfS/ynhG family protein